MDRDRIVGIIPAGGKAKRIHGFFKEMMPIGINEANKSKFIVSSEQIINNIIIGGAVQVHFILGKDKSFITEYFDRQEIFPGSVVFSTLKSGIEDLGMPFTIDSIYNQICDYDYVMMGMPDTVIEPPNCYSIGLQLLKKHKADLSLGLFKTDVHNKGGYVEFDDETKCVKRHIDKTSKIFPDSADNAWAVVCWNKIFTEYMHELLQKRMAECLGNKVNSELLFGDIIDSALSDHLRIVADIVDNQNGFYWDIAEPEKYFELLRRYDPHRSYKNYDNTLTKQRIFIGHGHSSIWRVVKDFIQDKLMLEWEEYNRTSVAGIGILERISEIMSNSSFAFLIMTGEDINSDGKLNARANVIHEIGLFQGKLGFNRAIVLLEDGCDEFSNIKGLNQIRFPKNNIMAIAEEIRDVLKREGFLPS